MNEPDNKQKELIQKLRVKSRNKYNAKASEGDDNFLTYTECFNSDGLLISRLTKEPNWHTVHGSYQFELYEYDKFSNVIRYRDLEGIKWMSHSWLKYEVVNDELYILHKSFTARYNEDNLLLHEETFDGNKNKVEKDFEYIMYGNERHRIDLIRGGRIIQILNSLKCVIEERSYSTYNTFFKKMTSRSVFNYDINGNLTSRIVYNANDDPHLHMIYKYLDGVKIYEFDVIRREVILDSVVKNGRIVKLFDPRVNENSKDIIIQDDRKFIRSKYCNGKYIDIDEIYYEENGLVSEIIEREVDNSIKTWKKYTYEY